MPRAATSTANTILKYFRTAPLENAELVLDLSRGAVKERQEKADAAREAQAKAKKKQAKVATAIPVIAGAKNATGPKKSHKKKPGPKPGSHRKATNGSGEAATVNDETLPPQGDQTGLDLE